MTIPSKFGNLLMHKREFYRLLAAPQHKASFLRSVLHNSCMCKVTEHLFGMERQHNVLILDKSEHPFSNMKIIRFSAYCTFTTKAPKC